MDKKSEKVGTGAIPKTTNKTIRGRSDQRPSGVQGQGHSKVTTQSRAVVPRGRGTVAKMPQQSTMIVPKDYTMREVQPAKNYDVVSFARAMNADFGPRVKQLFDVEREAALEAAETGVYIGWRCPEFKWDCQRVGRSSKCFCGHLLSEHDKYNGNSVRVPCKQGRCTCKAFSWIPSKPEEIGEFWFQRRRDFDPSTWRAKCRCKHTHEEHDPCGMHRCKKCGCGAFDSNFLCAACDKHWEQHETFFETSHARQQNGLPVGSDYLPFAEIPSLRNMVLTGEDDGDTSYIRIQDKFAPLPPSTQTDNSAVVPYGRGSGQNSSRGGSNRGGGGSNRGGPGRGGGGTSFGSDGSQGGASNGFRPVYD